MGAPSVAGAATTPVPGGEIRSLTGLRIVAATWVVCFHFSFTPGDTWTRFWEPLRPLVASGALGVDLFFVLSGFVITLTYLDQLGPRPAVSAVARFWWARVCRIWPVHALVTSVFGVWLAYKASRVPDGQIAYQNLQPVLDPLHWLEQMLMVQLWHRPSHAGASWSGPAWSISAEWLAYVCFPLLALVLWRLRSAPPVATGAVAVGCMAPLAWFALTEGGAAFPYAWVLRIGGGFLAGAFTCLTVRRVARTERSDRAAAWVAALAAAEVLLCVWWSATRGAGGYAGVAGVAFPFLVGGLALSTRGLSRALGTPSMVLGGRLSFALYLVHVPVFEVFWTLMGWYPRLAPGSTLAGLLTPHVLLLTVPLAYVLYRFVEEPARRRLRDLAGPRGRVCLPARHETADETLRALPAIGAPRRPRTPEVTPAPRPGRRGDAVGPVVPVGRTRPGVPSGTV